MGHLPRYFHARVWRVSVSARFARPDNSRSLDVVPLIRVLKNLELKPEAPTFKLDHTKIGPR